MTERILYFKGGRAIEEARELFPRAGELPDGGPDKFLLAALHFARHARFRLASFGPQYQRIELLGREVIEYGARPVAPSALRRRLAFAGAALRVVGDTLRFRPQRVLCGQDGPFALLIWLAARLSAAQFVLLAHNALALPTTSRAYKISNRFLCRHADLVIAHGPFVRDEAIQLGAAPARVAEFNNALDPQHVRLVETLPPKPQPASDADEPVVPIVLYV
ncbi:MAG: glycosyltransferase, partial [Burkholderiaceae bacterium]